MYDRKKVISIALAEVGYHEQGDNVTKYAAELDATSAYNGAKNGYAWCDMFVDWCFYKAFGYEAMKQLLNQPDGSAGAGCTYSLEYFRRAGRFDSTPQAGDQIFYGRVGDSQHTGLVYAVDGAYIYTVEGNYADAVCKVQHRLDDGSIAGYGHPAYDDDFTAPATDAASTVPVQPVSVTYTLELRELLIGCIGEDVAALQRDLIALGYDCGGYGDDGEFGAGTDASVKRYQSEHGLAADGVVGKNTMAKLRGLT